MRIGYKFVHLSLRSVKLVQLCTSIGNTPPEDRCGESNRAGALARGQRTGGGRRQRGASAGIVRLARTAVNGAVSGHRLPRPLAESLTRGGPATGEGIIGLEKERALDHPLTVLWGRQGRER